MEEKCEYNFNSRNIQRYLELLSMKTEEAQTMTDSAYSTLKYGREKLIDLEHINET
jgi:hypothetical protein